MQYVRACGVPSGELQEPTEAIERLSAIRQARIAAVPSKTVVRAHAGDVTRTPTFPKAHCHQWVFARVRGAPAWPR